MVEIFGIPSQALFGQLLLGLINGSFYALLSLGLAVIFGMLNIINFAHGAQYMLGAFTAFFLLQYAGLGYWAALVVAPIVVGITGVIIERAFLQWLYKLDHLYGLLLTFGLVLGLITWIYLLSLVIVLAAEVNVVAHRHLWPRALLTPFTDRVQLTTADERAYTAYAESERHKGFEVIDVDFEPTADAEPTADTEQRPG